MIINQIVSGGGGSAPAHYIEKSVDANGKLVNGSTFIDLTGVKSIGNAALYNAYAYNTSITSADMSSVEYITEANACMQTFIGCSNLTSVNVSGIKQISGNSSCVNMFMYCSKLVSVDFTSLESITSNYFNESVNSLFGNCNKLETVYLNKLDTLTGVLTQSYYPMFGVCPKLKDVYLGGLKSTTFSSAQNQIQYLFDSTTGSTATGGCTVHFPSNLDPSDPNHTFDASTLTGYPTFGGSSSYIHVAFDLPATE